MCRARSGLCGFVLRTFAAGVAAGGVLTLVEGGRALASIGPQVATGRFAQMCAWYLGAGFVLALAVGIVASAVGRASSAGRIVLAGAVVGGPAATAILLLSPRLLSPASAAVAVLAGVVFILLLRLSGGRDLPLGGPATQAGFGAAVLIVSLLASLLSGGVDSRVEIRERREGPHPSVLLIIADAMRHDHTTIGGYSRNTTPNLQRFSEDATVFLQARATSSWTKPSVGSILTGLPPGIHGAEAFESSLPASATTVAEVFSSAGYSTGLFSDNVFVTKRFGFAQGFGHVVDRLSLDDPRDWTIPRNSLLGRLLTSVPGLANWLVEAPPARAHSRARGGARLVDACLGWIDSLPAGDSFFGYLHFMEPHWPYPASARRRGSLGPVADAPDLLKLERGVAPFRQGEEVPEAVRQHWIDRYDEAILSWDDEFGRLLEELRQRNLLKSTILAVTADHGESFYEHGVWEHRSSLHEEQVHVPLVVSGAGFLPVRSASAVSILGLSPTLVRAAGFEPPAEMTDHGRELLPVPEEHDAGHFRLVVGEDRLLGAIRYPLKWIVALRGGGQTQVQCFDLNSDPGERDDLAAARGQEAAAIRDALLQRSAPEGRVVLAGESAEVDDQAAHALRGLGYWR